MKKLIFLILLSCSVSTNSFALSLQAEVDKTTVSMGESFNLTLSIDGTQNTGQPDFRPLREDFEVLGSGSNSQVKVTNGKTSAITQWTVVLSPKSPGTFTIPAVTIGSETSKPLIIKVKKSQATSTTSSNSNSASDVFLEISTTPNSPFVQSQIIYTAKLFYNKTLEDGVLTDPEAKDAVITRLGKDTHYQKSRFGNIYQVVERNYAVFPQKSGNFTIKPAIFRGKLIDPNAQYRSLFDQMLNRSGKPIRLISNEVSLTVKPKPAKITSPWWLPAKNFTIKERWSNYANQIPVGEPLTRTITLRAEGLTAAQLPAINQQTPTNIKEYPDQAKLNTLVEGDNVIGFREQKTAIIPTKTGKFTLPEIKIAWWNTTTNQLEVARIPSKTFTIIPALNSEESSEDPANPSIEFESANDFLPTMTNAFWISSPLWMYTTLLFFIAWLFTTWLWWQQRKRTSPNPEPVEKSNPYLLKARRSIKEACKQNNVNKVYTEIINWAKIVWPEHNILNFAHICELIQKPEVASAIKQVDTIRYSSNQYAWEGQTFWNIFKKYHHVSNTKNKNQSPLPGLYAKG